MSSPTTKKATAAPPAAAAAQTSPIKAPAAASSPSPAGAASPAATPSSSSSSSSSNNNNSSAVGGEINSSPIYSKIDSSTLSSCTAAASVHIHLKWDLNFTKKTLSGSAQHTIQILQDGCTSVAFDSSSLTITDVLINTEQAEFILDPAHPVLGTKVTVFLPQKHRAVNTKINIVFFYAAAPSASAIQWLDAAATHGKKHPYVYTQCQAIHARSLLPCMDTPGVKSTYSAEINAPEWCTVLMSALAEPRQTNDPAGCFRFSQQVPTPAYLIALAAGQLESRDISQRVKVWAEPGVVAAAASDFSQTEDFLRAAEDLTCPYVWTRYDVLCLPPSFPYGGMENPCLTFATPTLLTGDKSLADVIAHEIAHSWTGNLVTNHTWSHFFLNEGWTMWLQRKIEQRVKGGVEHLKLSAQSGWNHLSDDVALMGSDNKFTKLVWPLEEGADPDDAFSGIPYEKGFNLLYQLEMIVGSSPFETFAKAYIQRFKYSTVTSGEFKDFFLEFFSSVADVKIKKAIKALDWDDLLLSTGMPKSVPDFSNSLSTAALELGQKWAAAAGAGTVVKDAFISDISGWSTQQRILFLEYLLTYLTQSGVAFSHDYLRSMDAAYAFTSCANAEIKFRWQSICLRCEAPWIVPHVVSFITSQGRMKYVRPLYRALRGSKVGARKAIEAFAKHSSMYHPIARKMLQADLAKAAEEGGGITGDDDAAADAFSSITSSKYFWPLLVGTSAVAIALIVARSAK